MLYQRHPPQGEPLQGKQRFNIPDDVPDEDEIVAALRLLRNNKAPGPSRIRNEDLKFWYANQDTDPAPWRTVVDIVQLAFRTGQLPTFLQCNILVLIPKSEPGQVTGIGLLESVWKLIMTIIHSRLLDNIQFH